MVKLDTSKTKPDGGGGGIDKACDCLFMVEKYEEKLTEGRLDFEFVVLSGTDPSQIGKKRDKSFFLSAAAAGILCEFACAIGCYTKDQWKADIDAGIEPDLPLHESEGRMFCAPVFIKPFDEKYWRGRLAKAKADNDAADAAKCEEKIAKNAGKAFPEIGGDRGFTFWAVGDPEADHVPLDADAVSVWPNGYPTKNGTLRVRGDKGKEAGGAAGTGGAGKTAPKPTAPSGNGHGAAAHAPTPAANRQQTTVSPAAKQGQPVMGGQFM